MRRQRVERVPVATRENVVRRAADRLALGAARPDLCQVLVRLVQGEVPEPKHVCNARGGRAPQARRAVHIHLAALGDVPRYLVRRLAQTVAERARVEIAHRDARKAHAGVVHGAVHRVDVHAPVMRVLLLLQLHVRV